MFKSSLGIGGSAKRDERVVEHFSLEATLQSYEVEELNTHQIASFFAEISRGLGMVGDLGAVGARSD